MALYISTHMMCSDMQVQPDDTAHGYAIEQIALNL